MTNQDLAAAKKDTKENSENYGTGDFNERKFEKREFNGGRPVYLCTFPKKLDPNKKTRFVLYFHGFGDARTKGPDMLKNRETIGGLDKHSKEKNENIVFVIPQGENPDGANYWGDTVSSQNKLENLINYSLHEAFEGKNTPETKVDKYLMGHSGANYAMERVLKNMPSNYFKGIGLFDTLYSKGTGEKYSDLLRNKHSRTDVYSVFRTIGGPGNNNPILKAAMAENKEGPKGHFETSTKDHGDIKYPGVPNALAYFVSSEKPETPVQPTEPSAPKNPDQRTA